MMAVNKGHTHAMFNVLLTSPKIMLEEDIQYTTQAEGRFNDVWGEFADWKGEGDSHTNQLANQAVQGNQRTRLFERLALDRDGFACQSKVPSVRGGNDGRSTLLLLLV